MTTIERQEVRGALVKIGFRRTTSGDKKCHYDRKLNGAYTEEWTHLKDKTRLVLKWDKKTPERQLTITPKRGPKTGLAFLDFNVK